MRVKSIEWLHWFHFLQFIWPSFYGCAHTKNAVSSIKDIFPLDTTNLSVWFVITKLQSNVALKDTKNLVRGLVRDVPMLHPGGYQKPSIWGLRENWKVFCRQTDNAIFHFFSFLTSLFHHNNSTCQHYPISFKHQMHSVVFHQQFNWFFLHSTPHQNLRPHPSTTAGIKGYMSTHNAYYKECGLGSSLLASDDELYSSDSDNSIGGDMSPLT